MRAASLYLLAGALACVGAGVHYYGSASASAVATVPKVAPGELPPGIEVRNLLDPEILDARPLTGSEQRPGYLVFAAAEGETVTGVAAVCLCPARQGVPSFEEAHNLVAVQEADAGLRLSNWIVDHEPEGAWFVHYALWIDGAHGREWRSGWAAIAIGDVAARGVRVLAPARLALTAQVATADGEAIPGVLVALDDGDFEATTFRQYAFTDELGTIRLSGLEPGRAFRVSTPFGAGPCRRPSEAVVTAEVGTVELVVPLDGGWDWKRFRGAVPIPGAALTFESADLADDRLPTLWPSSPWIGPGRSSAPPIYVLHPRGATLPSTVRFAFEGFAPLVVDPTSHDHVLAFRVRETAQTAPVPAVRANRSTER